MHLELLCLVFLFCFFSLSIVFKIHLHWSKGCGEYVAIKFSNNLINQASYPPEEVACSFAAGGTCRKRKASFSSLEIKNYLFELESALSPDNLDNFSKSTNWPGSFSLSARHWGYKEERVREETSLSFRRQMINNQINAKVLVFKL